MKTEFDSARLAKIYMMNSLLDMVTPNIRGVACRVNNKVIDIIFLYEGKVTEDDEENCSEVETLMISNYPEEYTTRTTIKSLDLDKERVVGPDFEWIYLRKELFT